MTPKQQKEWSLLVKWHGKGFRRPMDDAILAADAELKRLREQRDALLALLKRCLPIVQADAQMMADISRFAPPPFEEQAKHDSTEYESEKLVREIPVLIASVEGAA